ncbi:hypothetical protein EDC04DRAFT_2617614 [Pisolithus marmoratus]|nr:hypothetical protein EDC04DRAFT_2617614 [Pisolithus marmoratus]
MSQNVTNTGLPTPTATQDWTAVPDKAIQSASEDEQEIADMKYTECQCWKRAKEEQKAAEEAAERVRVAQVEAKCQEEEACEAQAKEARERAEHTQSEMPVMDEPRASAPVPAAPGNRPGTSVLVPAESGGPGLAEGLKCVRARVECTFELAKASKHGKKSCDQCSGLKEQLKSPEVEVQAGPSRSKSVTGEMLVAQGLHTIAAAIDWHTSEMVKHQEMAKETQRMQRQFNNCLYELLQETEYQQVAEVGESSDEESTSEETSDGETDEDTEGEEAPESDPEVRRPGAENKGAIPLLVSSPRGTVGASIEVQRCQERAMVGTGTEVTSTRRVLKSRDEDWGVRGPEGGSECRSELWGARRDQSCCSGWGPNQGETPTRIRQMMMTATAYPINGWEQGSEQRLRAEGVQDENIGGRQEQDNKGDVEEWKVGFHKLPKGVNREASVSDHESKEHLSKKVQSVAEPESENWTGTKGAGSRAWGKNTLREDRGGWRRQKVVSTPGQASEVVTKAGLGETTEQWNK